MLNWSSCIRLRGSVITGLLPTSFLAVGVVVGVPTDSELRECVDFNEEARPALNAHNFDIIIIYIIIIIL